MMIQKIIDGFCYSVGFLLFLIVLTAIAMAILGIIEFIDSREGRRKHKQNEL